MYLKRGGEARISASESESKAAGVEDVKFHRKP